VNDQRGGLEGQAEFDRMRSKSTTNTHMNTKLNPTQNDLPEKTRRTMIALLNQHLADAIDLGLQAKQAHWNVKGPNFIALHELFDKVADAAEEFTDEFAERAVELGGFALGTIQTVSRSSRLPAYPLDVTSGKDHVVALSNALAKVGASIRTAIDAANDAKDADTADLFTQSSRAVDKLLWQVEAHAQS
jgi:starvation-inducible DNA-binding protein